MRSIIFVFCAIWASTIAGSDRYDDVSSSEEQTSEVVEQLLQHYHQIDLAPFVAIEKAKENAKIAIIATVSELIKSDRTDEAKRLLDGTNQPQMIRLIVTKGYDGNFENTVKVVEFLKTMDDKREQMVGFSALYDVMKKNKDMRNPVVVEIAYWMRHHVEEGDMPLETDEYPERFLYFDTEKYSIINDAMEVLGEEVRRGDFETIWTLARSYPGALSVVMPRLVEAAYSDNVNNFNAVLGLAKYQKLPQMLRDKVYDALLTEMYENNHLNTRQFETLKDEINSSSMTTLKKKLANLSRNV